MTDDSVFGDLLPSSPEVYGSLSEPNPTFNLGGREKEIVEINTLIDAHLERRTTQPFLIINIGGFPGVGKTSLLDLWEQQTAGLLPNLIRITNLTAEEIVTEYSIGNTLAEQLAATTFEYRINVVRLPNTEVFRLPYDRNNGNTGLQPKLNQDCVFREITRFMLTRTGRMDRNKTILLLESNVPNLRTDYIGINCSMRNLNVKPLSVADIVEIVGDRERGLLIHTLSGGYPPAVRELAMLTTAALQEGVNPEQNPLHAVAIASKLRQILVEEGIWSLLTNNPDIHGDARMIEHPEKISRQLIYVLAMSDKPLGLQQMANALGLTINDAFYARGLIWKLTEWVDLNGKTNAGYALQEPLKTILRNIFNIYGNQLVMKALGDKNQEAPKLPKRNPRRRTIT